MRPHYFVACCFVLLAPLCYGQAGEGAITGTVLDEHGRPIEGAQVCVSDDLGNKRRSFCDSTTDKTGQFQVQHVPLGKHDVDASKPEEGYAGSTNGLPTEAVNLTSEDPLARVILKLGPKDGILVLTASDKCTGKPVYDLWVEWSIPERYGSSTTTAGLSRWS